jgi:hypothetical protein
VAKKLSAKSTDTKGISPDDLKREIAEVSRQKGLASEYAGNAGKATASAIERHGLEKTAFTFARRLSDVEEGKRSAIIRSSLDYWYKLGFFDQFSMFDDLRDILRTILEAVEQNDNGKPDSEGSETMKSLTGTGTVQ